MRPFDFEHTTK